MEKSDSRAHQRCDQGCCAIEDWPQGDPAPSQRHRCIPRKMKGPGAPIDRDTPSEENAMNTKGSENGSRAETTTDPAVDLDDLQPRPPLRSDLDNPEAPPVSTTESEPDVITSGIASAIVVTPPAAKKRPVRPPPLITCDPPPTQTIAHNNPDVDNLRALHAFVGTDPAKYHAIVRRQMIARDLRLGPILYNWLVFGISPGAGPPHFPLKR